MKDLSIIVPFHKGLFYLEDCLESILIQNLPEESYEVIVLGDSPQEGVVSYVEKFEKKGVPIRYIQWIDNKGCGYARNKGLSCADGEYVYFLDCDDYMLDGCMAKLLKCAKENDADVVRGDIAVTFFKRKSADMDSIKEQCLISSDKKGTDALLSVMFKKEITVLNMLIKKSLIDSVGAAFPDDVKYFCDMPFVTDILANTNKLFFASGAILGKRERNDPIHYPSLNQSMEKEPDRVIADIVTAYKEAYSFTESDLPKRKNGLNRILCDNVLEVCIYGWKVSKDNARRCPSVVRHAFKRVRRSFSFLGRMVLLEISRGRFKHASFYGKLILIGRKKDGLFGNKIQWYRFFDKLIFRRFKRKTNWIVFESFFGRGYNDNPKYLYEYIRDHYGNAYRYIWVIDNPPKELKKYAKTVKFKSLKHVYYSTRSKYHVYNVRQPGWFKKEDDMVLIETWHGTPLKKLVFDLDDIHMASQVHKASFYRDSRLWDYLISANRFSTDIFERAFDVDRNIILETGYPRNDVLYSENGKSIAGKVKRELNIPLDKRIMLYAPTWRDNSFFEPGRYKFDLALDLAMMQRELGDEWVILLRTHYHIANSIDITPYKGFVYNVSDYSDISLLYLISDICITDYSSVLFDYANLRRPLLFYVYDFDEYKDEMRGMYLDMETELPGPMLKTTKEVIESIKNIDMYDSLFRDRYDQFYDKYCHFDDGHASKRIVDIIFEGKGRDGY